ncbi:SH3 domain-containing protein [Metabacillus sp. 84]|uniref:SH3 domain-containing protein n=1 Tax=unclassified Metabacillus TaxID=2675274 RepID=UPI003CF40B24
MAKKSAALLLSFILIVSILEMSIPFNPLFDSEAKAETNYQTTGNVNVRSGPGTHYSKIGVLSKGSALNGVSKTESGWYKIKFGNQTGYVSGAYVASMSSKDVYITTSFVNIRSAAKRDSQKLGSVDAGYVLADAAKEDSGWYSISYKGESAYVSSTYVTSISSGKINQTSAYVNIRSSPSRNSQKLGSADAGYVLANASKAGSGWYKITYKGRTAYVSSAYVTSISAEQIYQASAYVNIRSSSSRNSKKLGSVDEGYMLAVVSKINSSWYKINYKGKTGYVSSSFAVLPGTRARLDVEKLSGLGSSEQVILVTNKTAGSRNASIQVFEKGNGAWKRIYSINGVVGKNGMGAKQEGDGKTPSGKYTLGFAFYRGTMPQTNLLKKRIAPDSVWVDDSRSTFYNTWQSSKTKGKWASAERMDIPQYDRGFVINYNPERIPYKGSAIFFHIAGSSGYTAGCVAASRADTEKIMKWVNPEKKPVIIMTPEAELSKY